MGGSADHRMEWKPILDGQVAPWLWRVDVAGFAMEALFVRGVEPDSVAWVLPTGSPHANNVVEVEDRTIALIETATQKHGVTRSSQTFENVGSRKADTPPGSMAAEVQPVITTRSRVPAG
ncbi:MAG: hypothetical protein PHX77_03265 [Candidatus Bipolaricaulis sp.]|nr:hypothetical protein [Candidatus Bipolaricaulis sp.]